MDEHSGKNEHRVLFEAGVDYSAAAIAPVIVWGVVSLLFRVIGGEGAGESNFYLYSAYLVPQICFALAALFFFRRSRMPVSAVYAPAKPRYFLLAALLAFGLFSLTWVNDLFLSLFEKLGYEQTSPFPNVGGWYLIPAILIIAALPALFEETLFRGIQVTSMRQGGWGTVPTVLLSGALFALFHGNPAQTVYQFLCGAAYALLALRAKSVFPTVVAHFLNNAAVLLLVSFGVETFPPLVQYILYPIAGAVLLAVVLFLALKEKGEGKGVRGGGKFFLGASFGIAVLAVEWIAVLAEGFFA